MNGLHEEIRAHVLRLIRSGELTDGDAVSDHQIARSLGVSRTPVRSVLQRLSREGSVEKAARGWRIAAGPVEAGEAGTDGDALIARVLRGRIEGVIGAETFESDLMQRFGASRAAVKRVLERLSADGLVERRRGHGWRFAEALDAPEAVRESYVFRELLECGALARADWRDDPAERADLHARHLALQSRRPGTLDASEWFETNSRFHDYIARGSGNGFVIRALAQQTRLRRLLEYAEFSGLSSERIRRSCQDHLAIMEAIAAGERATAVEVLRRHLRAAAA